MYLSGVFESVGIEHTVGVRGMFDTSTYMITTKAPYHVHINIRLFTPYHALIRDHLLHTMHKYMIIFYSIPCMYKYMIIYSIPCTICMIMYSFLWQKRVCEEQGKKSLNSTREPLECLVRVHTKKAVHINLVTRGVFLFIVFFQFYVVIFFIF